MQKIEIKKLPLENLERMQAAALEVVDCIRVLTKSGGNLVGEVLRGHGEFTQWEHYPPDDVLDAESRGQYYFHAHAPDGRVEPDYGHFHTFVRAEGMPEGIVPAPLPTGWATSDEDNVLCHLIAISMTQEGLPERLFTTNRWVTAETWYKAEDVIAALDRFVIDLAYPSWPLNRWISAMFVLYRPQIEQLLIERDVQIEQWRAKHPSRDVFEDRDLEITSKIDISLFDQIEQLDQALESKGA